MSNLQTVECFSFSYKHWVVLDIFSVFSVVLILVYRNLPVDNIQFIYPNALGSIMHQYSYTLGSILCSIWYYAQFVFVTAHLSAVSVSHRYKHTVTQEQAQCHTVTVSHGLHTNDIRRIVLILCWYLADCALIIVNVLLCVLCFMFVFVLLCIELLCSPIVPSM